MFDDFLIRAVLAGIGVALAAAPLGCLVVWRRMAYFGDATAHAAVLGVALALAFEVSVFSGVMAVALAMGLLVSALQGRLLASDTVLAVLAHSSLAIGLVAVSLIDGVRVDLMAYLFGDILAVSVTDLAVIWGGAAVVCGVMYWRWSAMLLSTVSPELAIASGLNPRREQLVLTLALALGIAVAIKVVGALLITALLIIPAATARAFSSTPERMVVLATVLGIAAVGFGVFASFQSDTPTGPTIVCAAATFFAVAALVRHTTPYLGIRGKE